MENEPAIERDTIKEKSKRLSDAIVKSNEEKNRVISWILTCSVSFILIPVFLFKDIFGEKLPKNSSILTYLTAQDSIALLVAAGAYISLSAAVWLSLSYYDYTSQYIYNIIKEFNARNFRNSEAGKSAHLERMSIYTRSIRFFLIGVVLMCIFMILYKKQSPI